MFSVLLGHQRNIRLAHLHQDLLCDLRSHQGLCLQMHLERAPSIETWDCQPVEPVGTFGIPTHCGAHSHKTATSQLTFSHPMRILVLFWQPIKSPVANLSPCWAKVPPGPADFLKMLGECHKRCQRGPWHPRASLGTPSV